MLFVAVSAIVFMQFQLRHMQVDFHASLVMKDKNIVSTLLVEYCVSLFIKDESSNDLCIFLHLYYVCSTEVTIILLLFLLALRKLYHLVQYHLFFNYLKKYVTLVKFHKLLHPFVYNFPVFCLIYLEVQKPSSQCVCPHSYALFNHCIIPGCTLPHTNKTFSRKKKEKPIPHSVSRLASLIVSD